MKQMLEENELQIHFNFRKLRIIQKGLLAIGENKEDFNFLPLEVTKCRGVTHMGYSKCLIATLCGSLLDNIYYYLLIF